MASDPQSTPYRPHVLAKNERNMAMIADYLGGMSRREVADKYEIHIYRVGKLFWQQRVTLSPSERSRRTKSPCSKKSPGRPPVWADCPPELQSDFAILSKYHGKIRARAMLDPEFQA